MRCWKAPESLTAGRSYPSQIIAAINQCRVMVFILSKSSNSSPQVLREVERAVHHDIILVPFRIEPVTPTSDLEYYLSVPHWLDAYEGPIEPHLETLVETIGQLLGQSVDTIPTATPEVEKPVPPPVAGEREGLNDEIEQRKKASSGEHPDVSQASRDVGPAVDGSRKICPRCGAEYGPDMDFCPRDGSTLRARDTGKGLVGRIVAERYRVLRKMGQGGMGEVYLAEHVKMGRKCAIKMIHPVLLKDVDVIRRFGREAANASRITHPNVAAIYDFGEDEGAVYIAMEYVDGESLDQLLKNTGALSEDRAKDIACQVADALQAAHDEGVVHRDLKPDNVMIAKGRKGRDVVKVVDFGIAKAMEADPEQDVTQTGFVVGTPRYMSPEQLAGDAVDARSDLYSLGSILFEMLTGAPAFTGPTAEVVFNRRRMKLAPPPRMIRPSLPKALDDIVVRAMDPSPDNRFSSATDFRDAILEAALVEATERETEARETDERETAAREGAAKDAAAKEAAEKEAAANEVAAMELANKEAAARAAAGREAAARVAAAKEKLARQEAIAKAAAAKEAVGQPQPVPPAAVSPTAQRAKAPLPAIPQTGSDPKSRSRSRMLAVGVFAGIVVMGGAVAIGAFGNSKSNETSATAGDSTADTSALVGTSLAASTPSVPPRPADAAAKPAAKAAVAANNELIEAAKKVATAKEATDRAAADSARKAAAFKDSVTKAAADREAAIRAAASRAAPANPPAAPREIPPRPARNMSAEIHDVVERCVEALRLNSAGQMAQLYHASSPQDIANRDRLLALMRRAEARLSVASGPVVAAPEIDGESAHTDFTVQLKWRGTFGKRPEAAVRFRATIAPAGSGSQIGCRILGNADL